MIIGDGQTPCIRSISIHLNRLFPIILKLIECRQAQRFISILQITKRHRLPGIPCRKRRSAQSLSQNLVSESEAIRVVIHLEDAALRLVCVCVCVSGCNGIKLLVAEWRERTFTRSNTRIVEGIVGGWLAERGARVDGWKSSFEISDKSHVNDRWNINPECSPRNLHSNYKLILLWTRNENLFFHLLLAVRGKESR